MHPGEKRREKCRENERYMATFLMILALPIFLIVTGLILYPVAQAFGLLSCNCGRSPDDKWAVCSASRSKS